ncbi:ATP-dependent DNA helicase [Trichonephila clavipes]|nr:ATP-dependent DNA helicase [Trichonephila clavipes]
MQHQQKLWNGKSTPNVSNYHMGRMYNVSQESIEALDRTLRDFRGNRRIFGGALILLSGDFRQTLPIIPRSTPADELHACLKSSVLWRHLQKLTLKTNMRVQLQRDASTGNFAKTINGY